MNSNDGCFRVGALAALVYAVVMTLIWLAVWGYGPWANHEVTYTEHGVWLFTFVGITHGAIALFVAWLLWDVGGRK